MTHRMGVGRHQHVCTIKTTAKHGHSHLTTVDCAALLAQDALRINLDIKLWMVTLRHRAAYHEHQYGHFARPAC